jgi:hypothetical protein
MKEPIKKGDLAYIIEGARGTKGPNIGKVVIVGVRLGEHSKHGRMCRIHGAALIVNGSIYTEADCATTWLRKIEPPEIKSSTKQLEKSNA